MGFSFLLTVIGEGLRSFTTTAGSLSSINTKKFLNSERNFPNAGSSGMYNNVFFKKGTWAAFERVPIDNIPYG